MSGTGGSASGAERSTSGAYRFWGIAFALAGTIAFAFRPVLIKLAYVETAAAHQISQRFARQRVKEAMKVPRREVRDRREDLEVERVGQVSVDMVDHAIDARDVVVAVRHQRLGGSGHDR